MITTKYSEISKTILAILLGGIITFATQMYINSEKNKYDYKLNTLKIKTNLYEETIDIIQIIQNDLKPNLFEKMEKNETLPLTYKFSSVMNRNILYFNEEIGKLIKGIEEKGYWTMSEEDAELLMNKMVFEIKQDRLKLNI